MIVRGESTIIDYHAPFDQGLSGCKWECLVFHRLKLRVLPWQQLRKNHSLSFVMYISGVKFEQHCSNISEDINDSVCHCLRGTIYDVITFLICIIQKCEYL